MSEDRTQDWPAHLELHPSVFLAPGAVVVGEVRLGARCSVWYGAVLRGDVAPIRVGEESNVQDLCVLHVDEGKPVDIGGRVTVGHRAIVHGARVEDECLVGMGAIVLSGAVIGSGSLVGAGALVREGENVPPGSVVLGAPARVVGRATEKHRAAIERGWRDYMRLSRTYLARGLGGPLKTPEGAPGEGGPGRAAPPHPRAPLAVTCGVITVSDTRRGREDTGGAALAEALEQGGHRVARRAWARDQREEIRRALRGMLARRDIDAVVLTGGTGLGARDVTPEAVAPLVARPLPGFGQLFQMRSYAQVGAASWLSRAGAGVARNKLVVWLPGSPAAVALAARELLVPQMGHVVGLLRSIPSPRTRKE